MASDSGETGRRVTVTGRPHEHAEAHRLLVEARDLVTVALDAARGGQDAQRASDLVGRSSDRIGQALYHMRHLLRQ